MSRFTVAEQMGGGSSCSAPWLRSDLAHVKADFFPLSLPPISGTWVWYLVRNEHRSRPPTIYIENLFREPKAREDLQLELDI
jgi:hypothetical protein